MSLISITLSGYRNIKETTINFDKDVSALISTNNYGKSNFLFGALFALHFLKIDTINRANLMRANLNTPFANANFEEDFSATIQFKSNAYLLKYSYSFKWLTEENQKPIIKEKLTIKKEDSQKYTTVLTRSGNDGCYTQSETGRCNNKTIVEDSELLIVKLANIGSVYYAQSLKDLLSINGCIDAEYSNDASTPFIQFDSFTFIRDLSNAVAILKRKDKNSFEILRNSILELFPEVEIFDADFSNPKVSDNQIKLSNKIPNNYASTTLLPYCYIKFRYSDYLFSINQMSDGFRRILAFLIHILQVTSRNYNFIALEQPEDMIHPGLLRNFIEIIKAIRKDTAILLVSHSPFIVSYLNPQNLYIGIPNDDGLANFKCFSSSSLKKLDKKALENDKMIGELVFDLLSGDAEDKEYLKDLLK